MDFWEGCAQLLFKRVYRFNLSSHFLARVILKMAGCPAGYLPPGCAAQITLDVEVGEREISFHDEAAGKWGPVGSCFSCSCNM